MANLLMHCGAQHASRETLQQVPTPEPTKTWCPIPHSKLLDETCRTLEQSGFMITNQAFALWGETGERFFGMLEIVNGHKSEGYNLVVGLRNSHDKTFPAALVIGASVMVCDNLSFSGEIKLSRKHTRHIQRDLPQLVDRAVGKLGDVRQLQDKRFEVYKQTELSDQQAHDLMVRSLDAQVIPPSKMPLVIEEWRRPRHPEFAKDGMTAWRLQNAFTEALKGRLAALPRRSQALHGLLDSACGLHGTINLN